jgi:hypothetical protein
MVHEKVMDAQMLSERQKTLDTQNNSCTIELSQEEEEEEKKKKKTDLDGH